MGIKNFINRKVILPMSDVLTGNSIYQCLEFLDESQWWSQSELKAFQEEKLNLLIDHVYHNVPFYRSKFDELNLKPIDICKVEDLQKLPVITKEELRKEDPSNLVSHKIDSSKIIKGITSGSTGEPFQFYRSVKSYSMMVATGIRAWNWMGYNLGDHYAKLSQNPRKGLLKKTQDFFNNSDYYYIQHLKSENFNDICKSLKKTKPKFIRCYPDPLLFLAKYILKKNISGINPIAINTTGNILYPEAREVIEKAFKCPVYDSYSCEGGPNVSQAPGRDVYLSSMEYSIGEFLDDNGEKVESNEPGRFIVTDLWNHAMPFIRYDTQDYLVKSSKKSKCGRELLSVEKILGRDSDILITPDGRLIIVHIFTIYFEWKEEILQLQVRQLRIDKFVILIKVTDQFSKEHLVEIQNYWQNYLGEDVNCEVTVVKEIPLLSSGKRKFLVRDKSIQLETHLI